MTDHPAEGPAQALDSAAQWTLRWAGVTTQEAFDELRNSANASGAPKPAPREVWRTFFEALGSGGTAAPELAARAARVQQRVREDGATYNVHAPEGDSSRAWPLQLLPFIVDADEWAGIERGVVQRARLLDATLTDIHGAQTLLRDAVLPPSLVFAHPCLLYTSDAADEL